MSKKCDRSSTNDPQTCRPADLQIQPAIKSCRTPKIARNDARVSTSKCLSVVWEKNRPTSHRKVPSTFLASFRSSAQNLQDCLSRNASVFQQNHQDDTTSLRRPNTRPRSATGCWPTTSPQRLSDPIAIKSCCAARMARNCGRVSTSKCLPIAWEKESPNIARKSNHSSLSSSGQAKIRTTADDPDSPPDGARQWGRLPPPGRRVARQRTPSRDKPGGLPSPASSAVPRRGKTL